MSSIPSLRLPFERQSRHEEARYQNHSMAMAQPGFERLRPAYLPSLTFTTLNYLPSIHV